MLYLSTRLNDLPLLSLRSSGRIGTILRPIINPHNLHIDGFWCQLSNTSAEQILLDMSVRDISSRGLIINDHQDISDAGELIRLQPVLDIQYSLIGKQVIANKKKLGKIIEYAIDIESLFIQKFYVQPPVWQSINQHRLTFDRASIIEITDKTVVVNGPEITANQTTTRQVVPQAMSDYSAANSSLTNE